MALASSLTDRRTASANSSSYTFSACALGTAVATRTIIVGVWVAFSGVGSRTLTVTLGGNAMTAVPNGFLDIVQITSAHHVLQYFYLAYPSNTSGDIIVGVNSNVNRSGIKVFRLTDMGSLTPYDTASDQAEHNPAVLDIDVPAGGSVLAMGCSTSDADGDDGTFTGTGFTQDTSNLVESNTHFSGHGDYASAQAPLSLSLTFETAVDCGGFALSFAPAAAAFKSAWARNANTLIGPR